MNMIDVEVHALSGNEIERFTELIDLFENVFEMENFVKPPTEYLRRVLNEKGFFVIVALSENRVVGGLTAYTLQQYYSEKPLAYIYDLAVHTEYQRKGIGKKIIQFFKEFCNQLGYEEIFVQADKVDDHALRFYRLTGGVEEDVSHFYYSLGSGDQ